MAPGNFEADTPGFKSLLLEIGACGYPCELGYSEDDMKCIEEEWLQLLRSRDKPSLSTHALFGCRNQNGAPVLQRISTMPVSTRRRS